MDDREAETLALIRAAVERSGYATRSPSVTRANRYAVPVTSRPEPRAWFAPRKRALIVVHDGAVVEVTALAARHVDCADAVAHHLSKVFDRQIPVGALRHLIDLF